MTISDISLDDSSALYFNTNYSSEVSPPPHYEENDWCSLSQKSFAERVHLLSEKSGVSTYLVDKLILAKGPSDAFRAQQIQNWEAVKDRANWWGKFQIVVFVGTLALSVVSIAFFPLRSVVLTICALTSLSFSSKNYLKAEQAQEQMNKWNTHPAQSIAETRGQAYSSKDGFSYVMKNRNIFHQNEMTWLYERSLKDMLENAVDKISPSNQALWVKQFVTQNLLSFHAIDCAYEPQEPKKLVLGLHVPFFAIYQQDVLNAEGSFTKKANQIRLEAEIQIEGLQKHIITYIYVPNRSPIYLSQTNPLYSHLKKQIEDLASARLKQIEQERDLEISRYFDRGYALFKAAYDHWERQSKNETFFPTLMGA